MKNLTNFITEAMITESFKSKELGKLIKQHKGLAESYITLLCDIEKKSAGNGEIKGNELLHNIIDYNSLKSGKTQDQWGGGKLALPPISDIDDSQMKNAKIYTSFEDLAKDAEKTWAAAKKAGVENPAYALSKYAALACKDNAIIVIPIKVLGGEAAEKQAEKMAERQNKKK